MLPLSRRVAVFLYCNISELNRATKEFFSVSLKFDHISYSCSDELDAAKHTPVHYTESFRDVGLDNISCKMKYLKFKSIKHNIIMLVPNASDSLGVSIEITQYPEVDHGVENFSFKDNTIFW